LSIGPLTKLMDFTIPQAHRARAISVVSKIQHQKAEIQHLFSEIQHLFQIISK
jgi:hypothetical protein